MSINNIEVYQNVLSNMGFPRYKAKRIIKILINRFYQLNQLNNEEYIELVNYLKKV